MDEVNDVNDIFVIKDIKNKNISNPHTNKGSKALMKINEIQSDDEDESDNENENQDKSSFSYSVKVIS